MPARQPKEPGKQSSAWKEATEALLKSLPESYAPLTAKLHEADCSFREAVGKRLEDALNRQVAEMPQASYDDKRALAKWVNAELRRFALALICPKTGRPAALVADKGRTEKIGRFQFLSEAPDGRMVRAYSSATLPRLELIAPGER
jgi:hypothetical protein